MALGTAGYMSPEQVRGEKLDARTDLFSFGVVLYEMATGQQPFTGDTAPALHDAILKLSPVPARQLNPVLPPRLEAIVTRALEKDREMRHRATAEMLADLEIVRGQMKPGHHFGRWAVASAAVIFLMIVGAVSWFSRTRQSSQTFPNLKLQQLTINSSESLLTGGAISPDGKYLAYTDLKGMHIKLIGSEEAQSVPLPGILITDKVNWEIVPGAWFPDSERFLANAHPASIYRWHGESQSSLVIRD